MQTSSEYEKQFHELFNTYLTQTEIKSIFLSIILQKDNMIYWGHSKMTSPGYRGSGYPKLVTKSDIVGRRVHANSDMTTKKSTHKLLFSACFWSARQHLSFGVDSSGGFV